MILAQIPTTLPETLVQVQQWYDQAFVRLLGSIGLFLAAIVALLAMLMALIQYVIVRPARKAFEAEVKEIEERLSGVEDSVKAQAKAVEESLGVTAKMHEGNLQEILAKAEKSDQEVQALAHQVLTNTDKVEEDKRLIAHASAYHWWEMASTSDFKPGKGVPWRYWCYAVNSALVAGWPPGQPRWESIIHDLAVALTTVPTREAHLEPTRSAVYETLGYLKGMMPQYPVYTDLIKAFESLLTLSREQAEK